MGRFDETAKDQFAAVTQAQNMGRLLQRVVQYAEGGLADILTGRLTAISSAAEHSNTDSSLGVGEHGKGPPRELATSGTSSSGASEPVNTILDSDAKLFVWEYARHSRELFLKLLVLYQLGDLQGPHLDATVQILGRLLDTRELIRRNGLLLYEVQWPPAGVAPAAPPPSGLPVAVDVLTSGTYTRLPSLLEVSAKQAAANRNFAAALSLPDAEADSICQRVEAEQIAAFALSLCAKDEVKLQMEEGKILLEIKGEMLIRAIHDFRRWQILEAKFVIGSSLGMSNTTAANVGLKNTLQEEMTLAEAQQEFYAEKLKQFLILTRMRAAVVGREIWERIGKIKRLRLAEKKEIRETVSSSSSSSTILGADSAADSDKAQIKEDDVEMKFSPKVRFDSARSAHGEDGGGSPSMPKSYGDAKLPPEPLTHVENPEIGSIARSGIPSNADVAMMPLGDGVSASDGATAPVTEKRDNDSENAESLYNTAERKQEQIVCEKPLHQADTIQVLLGEIFHLRRELLNLQSAAHMTAEEIQRQDPLADLFYRLCCIGHRIASGIALRLIRDQAYRAKNFPAGVFPGDVISVQEAKSSNNSQQEEPVDAQTSRSQAVKFGETASSLADAAVVSVDTAGTNPTDPVLNWSEMRVPLKGVDDEWVRAAIHYQALDIRFFGGFEVSCGGIRPAPRSLPELEGTIDTGGGATSRRDRTFGGAEVVDNASGSGDAKSRLGGGGTGGSHTGGDGCILRFSYSTDTGNLEAELWPLAMLMKEWKCVDVVADEEDETEFPVEDEQKNRDEVEVSTRSSGRLEDDSRRRKNKLVSSEKDGIPDRDDRKGAGSQESIQGARHDHEDDDRILAADSVVEIGHVQPVNLKNCQDEFFLRPRIKRMLREILENDLSWGFVRTYSPDKLDLGNWTKHAAEASAALQLGTLLLYLSSQATWLRPSAIKLVVGSRAYTVEYPPGGMNRLARRPRRTFELKSHDLGGVHASSSARFLRFVFLEYLVDVEVDSWSGRLGLSRSHWAPSKVRTALQRAVSSSVSNFIHLVPSLLAMAFLRRCENDLSEISDSPFEILSTSRVIECLGPSANWSPPPPSTSTNSYPGESVPSGITGESVGSFDDRHAEDGAKVDSGPSRDIEMQRERVPADLSSRAPEGLPSFGLVGGAFTEAGVHLVGAVDCLREILPFHHMDESRFSSFTLFLSARPRVAASGAASRTSEELMRNSITSFLLLDSMSTVARTMRRSNQQTSLAGGMAKRTDMPDDSDAALPASIEVLPFPPYLFAIDVWEFEPSGIRLLASPPTHSLDPEGYGGRVLLDVPLHDFTSPSPASSLYSTSRYTLEDLRQDFCRKIVPSLESFSNSWKTSLAGVASLLLGISEAKSSESLSHPKFPPYKISSLRELSPCPAPHVGKAANDDANPQEQHSATLGGLSAESASRLLKALKFASRRSLGSDDLSSGGSRLRSKEMRLDLRCPRRLRETGESADDATWLQMSTTDTASSIPAGIQCVEWKMTHESADCQQQYTGDTDMSQQQIILSTPHGMGACFDAMSKMARGRRRKCFDVESAGGPIPRTRDMHSENDSQRNNSLRRDSSRAFNDGSFSGIVLFPKCRRLSSSCDRGADAISRNDRHTESQSQDPSSSSPSPSTLQLSQPSGKSAAAPTTTPASCCFAVDLDAQFVNLPLLNLSSLSPQPSSDALPASPTAGHPLPSTARPSQAPLPNAQVSPRRKRRRLPAAPASAAARTEPSVSVVTSAADSTDAAGSGGAAKCTTTEIIVELNLSRAFHFHGICSFESSVNSVDRGLGGVGGWTPLSRFLGSISCHSEPNPSSSSSQRPSEPPLLPPSPTTMTTPAADMFVGFLNSLAFSFRCCGEAWAMHRTRQDVEVVSCLPWSICVKWKPGPLFPHLASPDEFVFFSITWSSPPCDQLPDAPILPQQQQQQQQQQPQFEVQRENTDSLSDDILPPWLAVQVIAELPSVMCGRASSRGSGNLENGSPRVAPTPNSNPSVGEGGVIQIICETVKRTLIDSKSLWLGLLRCIAAYELHASVEFLSRQANACLATIIKQPAFRVSHRGLSSVSLYFAPSLELAREAFSSLELALKDADSQSDASQRQIEGSDPQVAVTTNGAEKLQSSAATECEEPSALRLTGGSAVSTFQASLTFEVGKPRRRFRSSRRNRMSPENQWRSDLAAVHRQAQGSPREDHQQLPHKSTQDARRFGKVSGDDNAMSSDFATADMSSERGESEAAHVAMGSEAQPVDSRRLKPGYDMKWEEIQTAEERFASERPGHRNWELMNRGPNAIKIECDLAHVTVRPHQAASGLCDAGGATVVPLRTAGGLRKEAHGEIARGGGSGVVGAERDVSETFRQMLDSILIRFCQFLSLDPSSVLGVSENKGRLPVADLLRGLSSTSTTGTGTAGAMTIPSDAFLPPDVGGTGGVPPRVAYFLPGCLLADILAPLADLLVQWFQGCCVRLALPATRMLPSFATDNEVAVVLPTRVRAGPGVVFFTDDDNTGEEFYGPATGWGVQATDAEIPSPEKEEEEQKVPPVKWADEISLTDFRFATTKECATTDAKRRGRRPVEEMKSVASTTVKLILKRIQNPSSPSSVALQPTKNVWSSEICGEEARRCRSKWSWLEEFHDLALGWTSVGFASAEPTDGSISASAAVRKRQMPSGLSEGASSKRLKALPTSFQVNELDEEMTMLPPKPHLAPNDGPLLVESFLSWTNHH